MRFGLRALRRLWGESPQKRKTSFVRPRLENLEDRLVLSADFVQTNLVSDIPGMAATMDALLENPWGLVASPGSPWWVSNQGTGTSTLYNGQGVPQPPGNNPPLNPLQVTIPTNPNGSPLPPNTPIVPNLSNFPQQTISTVASNGDQNPYGVAFVPQDFQGGGSLAPGDILVSNFNDSDNVQATGSTIVKITPDGQQSTFVQGPTGLGLTTALGVLPQGFVLVGSAPATTVNGVNTVADGGLLILDSDGNEVMELSDSALLQGPWDLTVHNVDATHAQVFVSNVLSGTVTRIDLTIPKGGTPEVESETQIASGYGRRTDPNALVVGPTGLAYDAKTDTLYVASTGDNAIYAIKDASDTNKDQGKGHVVVQDPQHLHGPLALILAPNGDLIAANGDAVNADPNQPNELVEYTKHGQFVGQFRIDGGAPGAAFGLAAQQIGDQVRFAAVDDNTNTLQIWTFRTASSSHGDKFITNSVNPSMSPSPVSTPSDTLAQRIDAIFQSYNAALQSVESNLLAMDPQLSGLVTMFNADLDALESMILSKL